MSARIFDQILYYIRCIVQISTSLFFASQVDSVTILIEYLCLQYPWVPMFVLQTGVKYLQILEIRHDEHGGRKQNVLRNKSPVKQARDLSSHWAHLQSKISREF